MFGAELLAAGALWAVLRGLFWGGFKIVFAKIFCNHVLNPTLFRHVTQSALSVCAGACSAVALCVTRDTQPVETLCENLTLGSGVGCV